MKFTKPYYNDGDLRRRSFFTWWPYVIRDQEIKQSVIYWLENITIEEKFVDCGYAGYYWSDVKRVR